MPLGFLAVLSEPGTQVSSEEFQDWYNNEHVPLRMNYLPSFLTGARFQGSDNLKPSWLALYDIDDTTTFAHDSYTRLRANRSPREADLVARLEVLDRRTCEVVADSGESLITTSLGSTNPTKFIITYGLDLAHGMDVGAWAKDLFQELKGVKSWVRGRVFKCIDNLKTGTAIAGKGPEEQIVAKYLVLHEFEDESHREPLGAIVNHSREGAEITELRTWNLYRAYPGVAQGNLE
ncbi:hypothetical protein H0H81_007571 [Sphagnurus paluster]|uniref:Uncharacterized protein n=1 Tax=Sphagnurus paluster TaxID=117069 RepID=A0A9P7GJG2_9AGAR|nr:hypothetical protein H0H81_007571 [Sphagnurus paluster]